MSFWTVFDLMFDTRPYSWFNFRVDIDVFPFAEIYIVIRLALAPPDKDFC